MKIDRSIIIVILIFIITQSCKIETVYLRKTEGIYPLDWIDFYNNLNIMNIEFSEKFEKEVDTVINMNFKIVINKNDTLNPQHFSYDTQKELPSISYTKNFVDFRNEVFNKKDNDLNKEYLIQTNNKTDSFIHYFTKTILSINFFNPKIKIKGKKTKHLYFLLSIKYKNKKGKIINLKKKYILDRKRVLAPLINTH